MRRIYTAIALLIIAAILCTTEYVCVRNNADKYVLQIENIEVAMEHEDTEMATEFSKRINEDWQKTVSVIDMLLYHDYVEDIGAELAAIPAYIEHGEKAELYATCERTKKRLMSLKNSEKPTAENII